MNVNIRYAAETDFEQIKNLIKELFLIHIALRPDLYKMPDEIFTKEDFLSDIKNHFMIIAEIENKVIGVLRYYRKNINSVNKNSYTKRTVLFINALIVDKNYRNKKVASTIIDFFKEEAIKDKITSIELRVNANNKLARKFYKKNDFKDKEIRLEFILP